MHLVQIDRPALQPAKTLIDRPRNAARGPHDRPPFGRDADAAGRSSGFVQRVGERFLGSAAAVYFRGIEPIDAAGQADAHDRDDIGIVQDRPKFADEPAALAELPAAETEGGQLQIRAAHSP